MADCVNRYDKKDLGYSKKENNYSKRCIDDNYNLINNAGTGITSNSGIEWTNPNNIIADDNNKATINLKPFQVSKYLIGNNLGFNIPTNSIILGIEVILKGSCNISNHTVYLTKDNITFFNKTGKQTSIESTKTYGSSTDLWGTTWTVEEINSSNFGASFRFGIPFIASGNASINNIKVKVYYFGKPINEDDCISIYSKKENNYSKKDSTYSELCL